MEKLQYVIEDRTIAELLGIQNFSTDESAILELVKNAYDARASFVNLVFSDDSLVITDDGIGMNLYDIKNKWMHVGQSTKKYKVVTQDNKIRVLAGSKGIGRFALARLGNSAHVFSKSKNCPGVLWETDWDSSSVELDNNIDTIGTKVVINNLRTKWNKKKVQKLIDFLSKTCNDNNMSITINHPDIGCTRIEPYFSTPTPGVNCQACIKLYYHSNNQMLSVDVISDEFLDSANQYCAGINLQHFYNNLDMTSELKDYDAWELSENELKDNLIKIGDFSAQFCFAMKPSSDDCQKFLYKHKDLPERIQKGVVLYRNSFSITSYEGKKDWLGFGKRSRKSPAAATHPSGAWRVRENQISGKVEIDKQINSLLQDLSNRQGLDENIYYEMFVEVILAGISEFERYRQKIIRMINSKNVDLSEVKEAPISQKVISNPSFVSQLSEEETKLLAKEIKAYQKANYEAKQERDDVETRYQYDIRILNVLSTIGLKASSIAHEMKNDRNSLAENINNIIEALKTFGMWDELSSPENTKKSYQNVPRLLDVNRSVCDKILIFMNTMLSEIEKRQFVANYHSVFDIIEQIVQVWRGDYAWIKINIEMDEDICFFISEDIIQVILDNLILNSIQQNASLSCLNISISVVQEGDLLHFIYSDDGKGLDKKYLLQPEKILEVHETTRKKGHGLGMWIVNNTVIMSGGKINTIGGNNGFTIDFTIGGSK